MAGLFGTSWDDPRTMATLNMAAGLLAGGGPSRNPTNLGMGLLGGLQQYQAVMAADDRKKLQDAQIEKLKAEALRHEALAAKGINPDDPSSIREWREFQAMTPEQQQQYLNMKRQMFQVTDIGGVPTVVGRGPGMAQTPLSSLGGEMFGQGAIAGAKTQAQEAAKAALDPMPYFDPKLGRVMVRPRLDAMTGTGQTGVLPMQAPVERDPSMTREKKEVEADVGRATAAPMTISRLETEIGRRQTVVDDLLEAKNAVGWQTSGFIGKNTSNIPGSPAYNLQARLQSIKARIGFGELQKMRFESPTGGALGQVAVQELEQLQNSIASLDLGQGEGQLKSEMDKLEARYTSAMEKLQKAVDAEKEWLASQGKGAAAGGRTKQVVRTGTYQGRRVIKYSDGSIEYAD